MTDATKPARRHDQEIITVAPHLLLQEHYEAPDGSVWVHGDLNKAVEAWAVEEHIPPIEAVEHFGDVESWAAYFKRFASSSDEAGYHLLTWSPTGLRAVLDYHGAEDTPGRCQWQAIHTFRATPQLEAWKGIVQASPVKQKQLVEFLEDHLEDIRAPDSSALLNILRTLRVTANVTAESVIGPSGATSVSFAREARMESLEVPPSIEIAIPILRGHTEYDDEGNIKPVLYGLPVRLRVSTDDAQHLTFRLALPTLERVLEDVYADRVDAAKEALGSGYTLLRAG